MYNPTQEAVKADLPEPIKQPVWSPKVAWVPVSDEVGNELQVPTLGSWTLNELEGVQKLTEEKGSDSSFVYAVVEFFYSSRGASLDDQVGDLKNVPIGLAKTIWEFFLQENTSLSKEVEETKEGKPSRGKKST